jgi:hypothetical protein
MSFGISPGVYIRERDISNVVPNVSTSSAAIVGYAKKGSTAVKLVTTAQQFLAEYGYPDEDSYSGSNVANAFHYSALAYLEQGNELYCRRVPGTGSLYGGIHVGKALDDSIAFPVGQSSIGFYLESGYVSYEALTLFVVMAKDPGAWSDNIKINIRDVYTDDAPDETDDYTFWIDVYYKNTRETGGDNAYGDSSGYSLVESWKVSRKQKTDGFGRSLYLETVINGYSNYILVYDNDTEPDTVTPAEFKTAEFKTLIQFDGGADGNKPSSGFDTAWDDFSNKNNYDVRILIAAGLSDDAAVSAKMIAIAEARKDCIAILDVSSSETTDTSTLTTARVSGALSSINSSYGCVYAGWVKINDPYNDKILNCPSSGYMAGVFAYNDYVANVWSAPMGTTRGMLPVLGVTNVWTEGECDVLQKMQINPLVKQQGRGHVVWGDYTLSKKASALQLVHVRRSLIVIEKAIEEYLHDFVGEPNNEITRLRITAQLEDYLDNLSARGAFQTEAGDKGYMVLCDTTNNTPVVIDRNELHVDIFVKPVRVALFIRLQTIITTSGTSFNELIANGTFI